MHKLTIKRRFMIFQIAASWTLFTSSLCLLITNKVCGYKKLISWPFLFDIPVTFCGIGDTLNFQY